MWEWLKTKKASASAYPRIVRLLTGSARAPHSPEILPKPAGTRQSHPMTDAASALRMITTRRTSRGPAWRERQILELRLRIRAVASSAGT